MIRKFICEPKSEENYKHLPDERRSKYRKFHAESTLCPEEYVVSVDVANPNSEDMSCVIKYNYEEYLKGNLVVEAIEYF